MRRTILLAGLGALIGIAVTRPANNELEFERKQLNWQIDQLSAIKEVLESEKIHINNIMKAVCPDVVIDPDLTTFPAEVAACDEYLHRPARLYELRTPIKGRHPAPLRTLELSQLVATEEGRSHRARPR
jgi:hypothetical protein